MEYSRSVENNYVLVFASIHDSYEIMSFETEESAIAKLEQLTRGNEILSGNVFSYGSGKWKKYMCSNAGLDKQINKQKK